MAGDAGPGQGPAGPGWPRALAEAGLTNAPDPELDYLADRVGAELGVRIAVVSLRQGDRRILPGQTGLPEPWASSRESGSGDLATEIGMAGRVSEALTDADGGVLGELWAMDAAPRTWNERELATLRQLAKACSAELRLRLAGADARRERARLEELQERLHAAVERSRLLLAASRTLTDARTVTDVRDQIAELFVRALDASHAELIITQDRGRQGETEDQRGSDPAASAETIEHVGQWSGFDPSGPGSAAQAVREKRLVHYADRQAIEAALGVRARAMYEQTGVHAVVSAPIHGPLEIVGVLQVGWDEPHEADPFELAAIVTIAGYVAQALERVRFLQQRISVAAQLQSAMLTELPAAVPGLRMSARYQPAAAFEQVGGDWYDCVTLPGGPGEPDTVAISVGDVTGHDIQAATIMGQLRAMMRQACWHHRHGRPSEAVTAVDRANADFELGASGTAVLAYLAPCPGDPARWAMRWTNAGHPPPVLMRADGTTRLLEDHGVLLGWPDMFTTPRTDAEVTLAAGDTLLLYTDGLIEGRGTDIDTELESLRTRLTTLRNSSPATIVQTLLDDLTAVAAAPVADDVVVFALQVPRA